MKLKQLILGVAKNRVLHIFLASMTVYAGFSETWETLADDFNSKNIKSAHGVMFVGVLHLLRSLSEFIEAADYIKESLD